MPHKTKYFKQVFSNTSDCYADTSSIGDKGEHIEGIVVQAMTEEMFVPLLGQMWAKTKASYKKRYRQKALLFTQWVAENYYIGHKGLWYPVSNRWITRHTTEELFEIWKKEN